MKKTMVMLCCMFILPHHMCAKNEKQSSVNSTQPAIKKTQETQAPQSLHMPIAFTQDGINSFFKDTINNAEYRRDILPNNLGHLEQFIEYGLKRRQGRAYTQSIVRLFNNVLKGSMYVNAYAFNNCLEQTIPLLHKLCVSQTADPTEAMRKYINDTLYGNFLNKFDLLKKDPDLFFNNVATDIAHYSQDQQYLGGDISCQEFRKTLMTFLEHSLSKVVWDPHGGIETWNTTKKIAQSIEQLLDQKIITDEDDINDLCISLVERYCLFLDINAQMISLDCYNEIKKEVLAQNLYFLELDEQEPFLEKKSQRILRALLEGEAKARAAEYGIIAS